MPDKSYDAFVREDIRRAILFELGREPSYTLNERLLAKRLELHGYTKGRDYIRTQLHWLQDSAEAIRIQELGETVLAVLTQRGLEVSKGFVEVPGIARPLPGE